MNSVQSSVAISTSAALGSPEKIPIIEHMNFLSFHHALENAIGSPGEINWEGIEGMTSFINHGHMAIEDALNILKPYFKNNMPAVILKALTNTREKVAKTGWPRRLSNLVSHPDQKVRCAVLQLIANWAHQYNKEVLGRVFEEVSNGLVSLEYTLPRPLIKNTNTRNSSSSNKEFLYGIDFLKLRHSSEFHSTNAVLSQTEKFKITEEMRQTIYRIDKDIEKLVSLVKSCSETAKKFKNGKCQRREVLDQLNVTWITAEKCNVWSENMQSLLMRELEEKDMSELLKINDRLNIALQNWQNLISMNLTDMCLTSENICISQTESREGVYRATKEVGNQTSREETKSIKNESVKEKWMEEVMMAKEKAETQIKNLLEKAACLEQEKTELKKEKSEAQQLLESAGSTILIKSAEVEKYKAEVSSLRLELTASTDLASLEKKELEEIVQMSQRKIEELEMDLRKVREQLKIVEARTKAEIKGYQQIMDIQKEELESIKKNNEFAKSMNLKADELEHINLGLRLELKRESILRKKAYNQIREMKGNIRVLARIRPPLTKNKEVADINKPVRSESCVLSVQDEFTINFLIEEKSLDKSPSKIIMLPKRYEFDACFDSSATQQDVYAETQNLIQSAFDGYNVCIFCYGQTGSGKSYTITGEPGSPGIIPLCMADIFNSENNTRSSKVSVYMLELYQDALLDLLNDEPTVRIKSKTDPVTGAVSVDGATIMEAKDFKQLQHIFNDGLKKRKTASTKLNIKSSRSHLIFTMLLERTNLITGCKTHSKLTFLDLAGSERVLKSGAIKDKERLNEARAINKSLSALADVIAALTSNESFIPYRNHKLTELMRDSLGGNAKTLMILNLSPLQKDAAETKNSLDYASRVKQITNESSRSYETREISHLKAIIEKQAQEIKQLKQNSK